MTDRRHYYDRARQALAAAHRACFNHPDLPVLGMSSGPFSGVNVALEIVAELEESLHMTCAEIARLKALAARAAAENDLAKVDSAMAFSAAQKTVSV